jgi:hypothetical protein
MPPLQHESGFVAHAAPVRDWLAVRTVSQSPNGEFHDDSPGIDRSVRPATDSSDIDPKTRPNR